MAKTKKPKQEESFTDGLENQPIADTQAITKLIYIGPNITRLGLSQFQVYLGGLPVSASKALETYPEIYRLFVPIERFAKSKAALERDGSLEQKTYQAVAAAFSI